ncbi:MAG TPA: methylenetetrahydrofolate reductase [NAD(P)H] [Solirubrobacteraceae bacterium]|jgi:methylenetetrahydrofolate reductase (NADPH)|nr:methylenetetrahydrofolate reductase [NAD(P)H] [Solirubrobacteraceae bacterium]
MRIDQLIAASAEPVFSFEFFPPKTEEGERNLFGALAALRELEPAFVSVTWGAGGSTRAKTLEIVSRIRADHDLEAMAHFTCVGASVPELHSALAQMADAGLSNVLALRGDPPRGEAAFVPHPDGLRHAGELVTLVREHYDFCIVGACYPETHPEASDAASDLERVCEKVQAGAQVLITNLFFENEVYFDFVQRARAAGVEVPIIPGIMPITNVAQIERISGLSGATIPATLVAELRARAHQPEAVLELGVAWATLQCAELLEYGAPGVHFYTLNRSPATRAILAALRLTRPWERQGRDSISRPWASIGRPSSS